MVDALKDVTVLSKGGLFTNEDALALANTNPGSAYTYAKYGSITVWWI